MPQIVRAPEDGWLIQICVEPEGKVGFGDRLCEFMPESGGGTIDIIPSMEFGVIKSLDGCDFLNADALERGMIRVRKNEPILGIAAHLDRREAGQIKGCTPRPTTVMARRNRAIQAGLRNG